MKFQLVSYPGYEQMSQALSEGEVDAIFPVYGEYYVGEAEQMLISDPVTVSTMTLLNNRSGTEGDQVAAVTGSSPFQHYVLQDYYPDTELVYYDSIADCIQAVIDGKADFTMMETAIKNERVETSYRKSIQTVELPIDVNISFGVKIGNRQLLAILNKSICMEQSQIVTSLIQHSQTHMTYTARDFVRDHMGMVLSVMVLVFVVILGMLFAYFRMRLQGERKLLESEQGRREAQWSAQHDGLTGLLNRSAFQEVCRHLAHSSEPLALMLVDVDDFKKVNDTYGHEVGDQALAKVGTLLGLFFRDEDFVIRYGGDEFLVLAINTGSEEAVNLEQKIRSINDILQKPEQFIPKLSISAGIAFSPSGYRDALFNQADRALDRVKASGRCGSCIYQNK
jgi:diguanylate cyclase (GGDEF)-like protein